jgi:hypothetical protein
MNQKIILTERQHQLILNKIFEDINEDINKQVLEEGLWEKTKYYLSKLGRYKANGKIFGKGKIDQEAAAQIQKIIDEKGNELIKDLDTTIKKTNPEFPNNEKSVDFLNTIMQISTLYDTIVGATKKKIEDEGYLTIDQANGLINGLVEYVKKFLDVDLTAAYSVVDEAEGNVLELTDDELQEIDEAWGLDEAPYVEMPSRADNEPEEKNGVSVIRPKSGQLATKNTQVSKGGNSNNQLSTTDNSSKGLAKTSNVNVIGKATNNSKDKYANATDADFEEIPNQQSNTNLNAKDVRAGLQGKRGTGKDKESTRMQTLKSNKLPMTLAGVGTSLGAFSWLANTDWFKHLFDTVSKTTDVETINQTIQNKSELIGNIKPGQGLTQLMNSMNNAGLTPNTTPEQFLEQVKILGDGDVNAGINALAAKGGIFVNPTAAKQVLSDIAQNPHGHGDNLGQIFKGKWAGTGKSIGDTLTCHDSGQVKAMITSTLTKAVPTIITKTAIKTGAGYAIAKGFGSILGPIGIGLVAGGALVKLMRLKGQKQSRAATLNMLYQSLRNLDGGTGIVKPETEVVSSKQASTEAGIESSLKGGDKGQGGDAVSGGKGAGGDAVSGGKGAGGVSNDDLYNSLLNMFRFVVASDKKFGAGSVAGGVATPKESSDLKPGTKVTWTNNKGGKSNGIVSKKARVKPNETIVDTATGSKSIPTNKLIKAGGNLQEGLMTEGRYIKNKELINYLNRNVSPKRVKEFEDFMNIVEQIRNKIKNIKSTDDKIFNKKIEAFKENPINLTDFKKMFNISSTNPKTYQNFAKFINDIFSTVYSGKFKKGQMIDKLAGMGRVNADDINEAEAQFQRTQIEKDAQDRSKFKKHLMRFMTDAIGLFQYMFQQRRNMEANGGQQSQNKQTSKSSLKQKQINKTGSAPTAPSEPTSESVENKNPLLTEHINRIKKIMYKID